VVLSEGSKGRTYLATSTDPSSFMLTLQAAGEPPDFPGCSFLEVVRQGDGFIGFRSSLASNRFIQPRKKAPHTLIFFNSHLGIWEQWEVLNEEESFGAKWSEVQGVRLRNRRMPLIELRVDMMRVGRYSSLLPPGPESTGGASFEPGDRHHRRTTASVAPSEPMSMFGSGGLEEDEQLKRISGLFLHEWIKFVEHEKKQRALVESEVARMASELAELRVHSVGRLERLRSEMQSIWETCDRAKEGRKRAIEASVAASWRRKGHDLVLGALLSWRALVERRLRLGGLLLRAVNKTARRRMGQALSSLRDHARRKRVLNRIAIRAVSALATKIMRKALAAWATGAREIRERTDAHRRRSELRHLRYSFASWRILSGTEAGARDGYAGASSDAHSISLSVFSAKREWRTKSKVLREWREEAASTHRLVDLSQELEDRLAFHTLVRTFASWRERVLQAAGEREELRRCIKRKQVAFSQFKAWYWQAFDQSTQDTIRRLVAATEDF
jgi:hypothetical protein